jgi:hypothetical protein
MLSQIEFYKGEAVKWKEEASTSSSSSSSSLADSANNAVSSSGSSADSNELSVLESVTSVRKAVDDALASNNTEIMKIELSKQV